MLSLLMKEQALTAGKGMSSLWVTQHQLYLSRSNLQSEDKGWGPNDLRATLDACCGRGGAARGVAKGKWGKGGGKTKSPSSF